VNGTWGTAGRVPEQSDNSRKRHNILLWTTLILEAAIEDALPFSIPALAATRVSQIGQSFAVTVFNNLTFLAGGYRDDAISRPGS